MLISGAAIFAVLQAFDIYDNLWRPLLWGIPAFLMVNGAVTIEGRGGIPHIPLLKILALIELSWISLTGRAHRASSPPACPGGSRRPRGCAPASGPRP